MKRKYPRSVRAAKRRSWTVVEPTKFNNVSYLGLMIWTDRNTSGKYVSSFEPTRFAFEQIADAAYFTLKWS